MSQKITFQSAAKPQKTEEGSETIPQGSTLLKESGSATPQTDNAVGDDIGQNKNRKTLFYYYFLMHTPIKERRETA